MPTEDERADVVERYGLAEGERESIAAELAERAQRIASDEILAWAKQYNARRREPDQPPAPARKPERKSAMTADWVDRRIRAANKQSERNLLHAVGDVLHGEIKKLRDENATLRERLDRIEVERGSASLHTLRAVVSGN